MAMEDVKGIVNSWRFARTFLSQKPTQDGLREFTERMNELTRNLISEFREYDPDFWSGVAELANNAATLTEKGAKLFVNGQDRTNL